MAGERLLCACRVDGHRVGARRHLLCNAVPILLSVGADAHLAAGCSAGSCPAAGALGASGLNQVLPELGFGSVSSAGS